MEQAQQETIYIASSVSLYRKPLYDEYKKQLMQRYPSAAFIWAKGLYGSSQQWLEDWPRYCEQATMLIFLADEGWIGRGVHTEIEDMLKAGKPVFYLYREYALAIPSLDRAYPVQFDKVTDSWKAYCKVTVNTCDMCGNVPTATRYCKECMKEINERARPKDCQFCQGQGTVHATYNFESDYTGPYICHNCMKDTNGAIWGYIPDNTADLYSEGSPLEP